MDHILSIVLFTPLVGLLVLLFLPSSNARAVKLWANVGRVRRLPGFPAAGLQLRPHEGLPVRRKGAVDSLARRHLPLGIDGLGLLLVMLTTVVGFLAILSSWNAIERPAEGILRVLPAPADRHAGRLHGARFPALLRVLGNRAGADVLHHRHLGRPAARLCGHQVHDLHADRQRADVPRHPDLVLPALHAVPGLQLRYRRPDADADSRRPCSGGSSGRSSSASP